VAPPSPSRLQPGDPLKVRCDRLDEQGAGVVAGDPASEHQLHVQGLLPGETAAVTVEHVSPHRREGRRQAWARLDAVETPSPDRAAPVCPGFGPCGGCPLQHLAYPAQVRWKGEQVSAALARHPALAGVPVAPCVPSPRPLGYRNQAKYVYGRVETASGRQEGRLALGAYAPRSHAIVDMAGCQVVEPVLDQVATAARDLLEARDVPPFDEVKRTGLVRYVVLRSNAAGQVLVTLVAGRPPGPELTELAAELRARVPAVSGVVLNVNPTAGNVLFGPDDVTLAGQPRLEDGIGPVRVELASRSFFQLNRQTAGLAYEELRRAAAALGPVARAIDAYAGAGGIAFCLAPYATEVVAIEDNAAATTAAAGYAARHGGGFERVRFVTGDAAAELARIDAADVVVLNPPRGGCAPAVLAAVGRLRPRLCAYLSCHPGTLARDLEVLAGLGLATREVRPYDMLPHTPHVEALALLAPAG
jgi:23S rRNA (uracil1939-C5)-methyltransferase